MKALADTPSSFAAVVALFTPCSGLWWVPLAATNHVNLEHYGENILLTSLKYGACELK